jgi:hypothetical protein
MNKSIPSLFKHLLEKFFSKQICFFKSKSPETNKYSHFIKKDLTKEKLNITFAHILRI